MAQSTITFDRDTFQGAAGAGGGTFVATCPTNGAKFTDKSIAIKARAIMSHATAGHQDEVGVLRAEGDYQNANGVVTAGVAATGSTNPMNSNTAGLAAATAESLSSHFSTSTLVLTVDAGNHVLATLTNNAAAGSVPANVTIIVDYEIVGST